MSDIRVIKKELRAKYRGIRQNMRQIEKHCYDNQIFNRLIGSAFYQSAKTVLCFVSTEVEVDTLQFINQALKDKKIVAVPKCLNRTGHMDFFIINSLESLTASTFNLLEPDVKKCKRLKLYSDSICIIPGFAFDKDGYRIGFGKGYYDRFLNRYSGIKVGICYNSCIAGALPQGKYDVSADYVVTPKYLLSCTKKTERNETFYE